ncbi:MAG: hypothetical protein UR65_C0009G0016, partial [Candidatus Moranbacteria bacterium GW2011_GWE2_35_164]
MELKEYIKIFKDNYGIFLMTVGLVLASGLIAQ